MQNRSDPSFFLTSTTALHHGDWEGRMVPPSNISYIVLAHLIQQGRGDALKPLLEWLILHELDDVLHGIRASYFFRLQREDMVEFQQQCHRLLSQIRQPFFEVIQPCTVSLSLFAGSERILRRFSVCAEESCKSTITTTEPCSPVFKEAQPRPSRAIHSV